MSWNKKRLHYPTWDPSLVYHRLDKAFTLQETQILNLSFSLKASFFVVVIWFGSLVVGYVCMCVCRGILAKKQLSKDEQSLGAKKLQLFSSSTIIASPNSDIRLYFLLKGLRLSIMKFSGLGPQQKRISVLHLRTVHGKIQSTVASANIHEAITRQTWGTWQFSEVEQFILSVSSYLETQYMPSLTPDARDMEQDKSDHPLPPWSSLWVSETDHRQAHKYLLLCCCCCLVA